MKKRILALLLVLVMVCGLLPMSALAAGSSVTIAAPNAASAKLYAAADDAKESDLLNGVSKSEGAYTVSLEDGDYTLALFDAQAASLGTIVLTVSDTENSFTVYAVSVTCENDGWVCGTDYTVTAQARSGGAAATVTRTITLGDGGCSFPCLEGDNVTAAIIPTGTGKSAGFASAAATNGNNPSVVTGAGFAALSGICAPATSLTVTYPYADTNEDGENDFLLEVGILKTGTYYVYDYDTPVSVSSPSASTVTATFMAAKNTAYFYKVSNPLNRDAVSYGNYVTTAKTDGTTSVAVTTAQMHIGDSSRNADTVIRDYSGNEYDSGDLYLAGNAPEFHSKTGAQGVIRLTSGGSCTLYPYRNWLIIENTSNAQVIEPDFHVQVVNVEGDPITVTENTANDAKKHSYEITANSAGTAVLLVTYDAVTADQAMGSKGKFFSAIRPENTGVLVVTVDGTDDVAANMLSPTAAVNTAMNETGTAATGNSARVAGAGFDAELDRLYFYTDAGATYSFTPEAGTTVTMAKAVQSGTVCFSAEGVSKEGDTVTLSGIPEGKTIVKLENGGKVSYQVIRATRTNVNVKDAAGNVYYDSASGTLNADMKFVPGDKVTLTYSKLEQPAQKLSGIYNMNCAVVPYGAGIAVEKGSGFGVYTFNNTPSNWTTTATIPASAEGSSYALTALIRQTGFGSYYGDHRFVAYEVGKSANFSAVQQNAWFGGLPAIELPLCSETMELTVNAVDEQDTPISNPTIEITDSNGAALTPAEGKYTVYPGKTYTYSAAAEGHVRVFGSFTVSADVTAQKIVIPQPAGNAWGGTTSEPQKDDNDIYQIGTGAELAWFAEKVNDGTAVSAKAVLTADIDLSNLDWTPIGNSTNKYTGTFDGDGHVISGLYINATSANQGLFGYIGAATISNLGVYGTVKSAKEAVGGIVGCGSAAFSISNCFNAAVVSGSKSVGGIVGSTTGTGAISNCYNLGSITAGANGLSGGINGVAKLATLCTVAANCYNLGTVNCPKSGGAINPGAAAKATNSYYLVGCYVTGTSAKAGTAKTADELKALAATLGEAYTADRWGVNDGYPILTWQDHDHTFGEWVRGEGMNAVYSRTSEDCAICGKTFTEESVTASVSYTAQYQGNFLFAPQSEVLVDSSLAERYGFTDSVEPTENVSVLDVLVAAHALKYGSSFTKETASDYLVIGRYGSPDKQFGVASTTAYGGFFYNRAMANDGTKYDDNNYNGTTVTTQAVSAGDLVEFFFYEDEFWGDTYNWFVGSGGYAREFSVTAGQGLELTLKGFGAMSASCFKDSAEMIASGTAATISDAQIYTVNLTTGAKTAVSGAVTDENGKVTLTFANAGTYTIAAYGTENCTFRQLLSLTTVRVNSAGVQPSEDITVTFRLIGAEQAAQDVDLAADDYLPNYVTWIPTGSYTLEKNATVYDLFTEALDGAGLTYVGAENNYVSTIYAPAFAGGYALSEFTNGTYSGWMYTVNGSHPNVGLKTKHLSNGDVVVWHYINDYRYEVADWFDGSSGTASQQNLWLKAADRVPGASDKTNTEQAANVAPAATAINGEAKAEVSSQNIADAIASAKQDGADSIVIAPVIKGDADKIEVELPTEAVRNIVSGTDAALTVQTDMGSLNIPNDTLAEIIKAAGGTNISMNVEQVDVADIQSKLPEGAQTENALAVNFSITSGDKTISSFGGKALEVSFPVDTKVYGEGKSYVVYIVSDDGSISRTTAFIKNGEAVVSTTHFSTVVVTKEEAAVFTDIAGHWAYDAILYVYNHALMNGVGNEKFNPGGTLSRAMLVTILYRLEGKPDVTAANPFKDVKDGQWYTDAIIWASENKLVEGYGSGRFGPGDDITREQMAKILFAYTKLKGYDCSKANDLADYTDAGKISAWALDAVKWANAMALLTGRTAETIVPGGNATRAEAATILMRYMENAVKE